MNLLMGSDALFTGAFLPKMFLKMVILVAVITAEAAAGTHRMIQCSVALKNNIYIRNMREKRT
jgi:hypothetical protein